MSACGTTNLKSEHHWDLPLDPFCPSCFCLPPLGNYYFRQNFFSFFSYLYNSVKYMCVCVLGKTTPLHLILKFMYISWFGFYTISRLTFEEFNCAIAYNCNGFIFHCCAVFYCVTMPWFIYPFSCQWTFELFPCFFPLLSHLAIYNLW